MRELAFLNHGLTIELRDERVDDAESPRPIIYAGGIVSFVEYLNENKDALHPVIATHGERDGVTGRSARCNTSTRTTSWCFSFANNINTIEGGMHLTGFRTAVTNAVNSYARKRGMLKENENRSRPTIAWKA